jgi:hypothetical protein
MMLSHVTATGLSQQSASERNCCVHSALHKTAHHHLCSASDDCKKWDAIPGSIHELERDDIWLAPFQCKLQQIAEERAGDDGEHQSQVRSLLLRLSSRGTGIDDAAPAAAANATAAPAAADNSAG